MLDIEKKPVKMYYTIGEVSSLLGESTSLVRFWANKFSRFIKPHRNNKGNRLFTPSDIANFKIIYHLVKERGLTLEGAQMRMKEGKTDIDRKMEAVERLNTIRENLKEAAELL